MKSWTYGEIKENLRTKKWKIIESMPSKYHEDIATDYIILDENNTRIGFHLWKDELLEFTE